MLFGDYFKGVITVDAAHPAMAEIARHFTGWFGLALHAVQTWPFWLALAGVVTAYIFYIVAPSIPAQILARLPLVHHVLEQKYFMDRINEFVFAGGARLLGGQLWKRADQSLIDGFFVNGSDQSLIDGFFVNGSARVVGAIASIMRIGQTGYLYHYAIAMILGVALMLWWFAPVMNSAPMVRS